MSLQEKIREDMKAAMKAKETDRLTTLRGILSAFTNELVSLGKTPQDTLSDEEASVVIAREAKKRKDAINQFTEGGRPELAEDEQKELVVLEEYLPAMMDKEEIRPIVEAKVAELGEEANMGQVMGAVMAELSGKADGGDVREIVLEILG
jgi:uncharacterized protein YqeY